MIISQAQPPCDQSATGCRDKYKDKGVCKKGKSVNSETEKNTKTKVYTNMYNDKSCVYTFLSDPGIPGVRSMAPSPS